MAFGWLLKGVKGVAGLVGGKKGPTVKVEGIADQVQDKWAERFAFGGFGLGCALAGGALLAAAIGC